MSPIQLKVITNAVRIRVRNGETPEEAVEHYPKLTQEEKEQILSEY